MFFLCAPERCICIVFFHMSFELFVLLFHVFTRLKRLDDMLSLACLSAEAVYKVLYWDNHTKSSRCASTHTHTQLNLITDALLTMNYTDLCVFVSAVSLMRHVHVLNITYNG